MDAAEKYTASADLMKKSPTPINDKSKLLETGPESLGWSEDNIEDDAVAFCAAAALPDSPILPNTRVRLATVATRYSWNRVFALPK